jgi:hypothetical protein
MTTKIEPVLGEEEWRRIRRTRGERASTATDDSVPAAAIAIAIQNDILPESEPRKITRDVVNMLGQAAVQYVELVRLAKLQSEKDEIWATMRSLIALHRALESYLPPEGM